MTSQILAKYPDLEPFDPTSQPIGRDGDKLDDLLKNIQKYDAYRRLREDYCRTHGEGVWQDDRTRSAIVAMVVVYRRHCEEACKKMMQHGVRHCLQARKAPNGRQNFERGAANTRYKFARSIDRVYDELKKTCVVEYFPTRSSLFGFLEML